MVPNGSVSLRECDPVHATGMITPVAPSPSSCPSTASSSCSSPMALESSAGEAPETMHDKLDQILVGLNLMIPVPEPIHHQKVKRDSDMHQLNDFHDQPVNHQHLPLQCDSSLELDSVSWHHHPLVPDSLDRHQPNDLSDQHVNHKHLPLQYDIPLVFDSFDKHQLNDLQDQRDLE